MSKKMIFVVFFAVAFSFPGVSECAGPGGWSAKYKVATLAPDGVSWAKQIRLILIPEVDKVTEGNLTFKIFWGGVMGDDEDYIKKMRIGQLDIAGMSGQGSVLAVPEMAVMELPFLFDDWDEVDYVKSKMAPVFDDVARKRDYMVLAYIDQDFDSIFSVKYDMTKLEHFSRAKVVSWVGAIEGVVLEKIGATPIPVNMPEAPTSIRQGMGDMIIAPSAWGVGTQLYQIFKYISPMKIRYSPGLVLMTWDSFTAMPKKYRDEYYKVRGDIINRFCKAVRIENEKCLEAQVKYGLKVVDMDPADKQRMKELTREVWDEQADRLYPADLLDQVLEHLEEFREGG